MAPSKWADCPECGRRVGVGAIACTHCGARVEFRDGAAVLVGDALPFAEEEGTWEGAQGDVEGIQRPGRVSGESAPPEQSPGGTSRSASPDDVFDEAPTPPPDLWPAIPGEVPPAEDIGAPAPPPPEDPFGPPEEVVQAAPAVEAPGAEGARGEALRAELADAPEEAPEEAPDEIPEITVEVGPEDGDETGLPADLPPELVERIARYEKLVAENPGKASPYILLGRAYEEARLRERAIGIYERLLGVDPRNQTATTRLHVLHGRSVAPNEPAESLMRRAPSIRASAKVPRTWRPGRIFLCAVAGTAALLGAVVAKQVYFPSVFRPVGADYSSSNPVWSPDGGLISLHKEDRTAGYDFTSVSARYVESTLAIVRGSRRGVVEQFGFRRYGLGWGTSVSWSPEGNALALASWDDEGPAIFHLDLVTKRKRRLVGGGSAEYSRDGKRLVFVGVEPTRGRFGMDDDWGGGPGAGFGGWTGGRENVFVYDLVSGEVRQLTQDGGENPSFSPDGRKVLYEKDRVAWRKERGYAFRVNERGDEVVVDRDYSWREVVGRDIHVVEVATGQDVAITTEGFNTHGTWVGRDGEWVSYGHFGGRDRGLGGRRAGEDAGDEGEEGGEAGGLGAEEALDGLEEGKGVGLGELFGGGWRGLSGGDLRIARARGGEERTVLSAGRDRVVDIENVSWSPDGRLVAFVGLIEEKDQAAEYMPGVARRLTGKEKTDIFFVDADGSHKRRFENQHAYKRNPKISPDGKRIAYELLLFEIGLASWGHATEVWVARLPR